KEQSFASYLALAKVSGGALLAEQHDPAEGIALMRQSLAAWRETGAVAPQPSYLALLAERCGRAGHPEDGLVMLDECLAEEQHTGGRFFEAEIYRLKGELTLQQESKEQRARSTEQEETRDWSLETGSTPPQAPSLKPQVPKVPR